MGRELGLRGRRRRWLALGLGLGLRFRAALSALLGVLLGFARAKALALDADDVSVVDDAFDERGGAHGVGEDGPQILQLAGHYHFAPKPVGIARGNEKGRVERRNRYLRES